MPRKVAPSSAFGKRLMEARLARGLTQAQLAEKIGSTQRMVSHYETVAEYPPAAVIVDLAKALDVSADSLLGLKPPKRALPKEEEDPETRRFWKRFQEMRSLPIKDQKAVIRLVNSLVASTRGE